MTNGRLLIAEDEGDIRDLLVRGLTRLGWTVQGVPDGQGVLECLDQPWTAVVTDLRMPGMDGLQVLAALRQRQPSSLRVMMTAHGDKPHILAALNAGAQHLIEKPFTVADLDAVLRRLIRDDQTIRDDRRDRRFSDAKLTERERELVTLVLGGESNKAIALRLGIGEQTVKNALSAAYGRLGVASRSELFALMAS